MEIPASSEKFLIDCSMVEIGLYKYSPTKQIELTHEFITLPLDNGKETLLLSLSFKHITKVEFLDNSEGDGAGLVLFVNDFMARKIQNYIDRGGTGFTEFTLDSYTSQSHKSKRIIVMDIQNKEPEFFQRAHAILHAAAAYHRSYVIQQMNKTNKLIDLPVTYIDVVSSCQWQTLMKLMANVANAKFMHRTIKVPMEFTVIDQNKNGISPSRMPVFPTLLDSSQAQHLLATECQQQRVVVGQIYQQQPTCHLPTYTVVTVPHSQPTTPLTVSASQATVMTVPNPPQFLAVETVRDPFISRLPPAMLAVKTSPQPRAIVTVTTSQPTPTHPVQQLPLSLIEKEEPTDMLFQLDHEQIQRHNQQQKHHLNDTATFGETTVAQYLAMESSTGVKLIPRPIKVPMQFGNNNRNSRSALPLLSIQTPPSTSQEQQQQLSPKSQQRTVLRSAGTAKVAKREREVHLIDDEESELEANPVDKRSNDTLFSFPPTGRDSCSVHYADLKYLSRNFMLNDTIIDFYLKYIQHCLVPQERRAKIFIFNSFFFGRLTQPPPGGKPSNAVTLATKIRRVTSNFQKVKNWTKKVNLFDMDYVVVPINEDIHWYLAIIVNIRHCICTQQVNEHLSTDPNMTKSDTKYHPPMSHLIVLNSLIDPAEDKHLAVRDQLGEYLHLEYADKHCQDNATFFNKQLMDVVVPTMLPQQKNFIDCGLFLLHFAQLFFTNPPRIVSRHSSFRRWYPNFEIKHKRDELRCVIMQLASHVKASDFVQRPTPKRKSRNGGRRPQVDKMQSIIDGMALMGRTRRYSDSELDGIMKDEYFSCLYRPRSFDSLVRENREKPLVLQPPTIAEMSRFKQLRRVRQEIFASTVRQGQMQ